MNEVEIWASNSSSSSTGTTTKVPSSALSVSLSSTVNGVYGCFDGDTTSWCHTVTDDRHATLTITTTSSINIAGIKVYNRLDCCGGRIRNAMISVKVGSSLVWSDRFDDNDSRDIYNFITTTNVTAATKFSQCITTSSSSASKVLPLVYNSTGYDQTFTVPANTSSIKVYMWGIVIIIYHH